MKKGNNPRLQRMVWTAMVVFVAGLLGLFAYRSWKAVKIEGVRPLPVMQEVSRFSLTERSGRKVSEADLRGKIWVANFIFTDCPGMCKSLSTQFANLQSVLRKAKNVRLVSFTIDPATDTPEVLSRYADSYMADKDKWLFLTGDVRTIHDLAFNTFKLPVEENPPEAVPTDGKYLHSSRFVLVDAQGRVRGYYEGLGTEAVQQLMVDIGTLMREQGVE